MARLLQILQDSFVKIATALVVAAATALFVATRDSLRQAAAYMLAMPLGLWLATHLAVAALAASGTYLLLLKTIRLGRIDKMTRVPVSGEIDPFLDRRLKEARQKSKSFCCILVDVDDFKHVNDQYNHEIGNHTLLEVAETITPRSAGEKIFRYGGDEFLIVSKLDMNETDSWRFASRLVDEVAKKEFAGEINAPSRIHLTISCGAVLCDGSESVKLTRERLVTALKAAKARGKNCAYLYNKEEAAQQPSLRNA